MEWLITVLDWLNVRKVIEEVYRWCKKDRRKLLPYREVVIGTYSIPDLKVDIRAEIVLVNDVRPDLENFLDRISMGRPYCPHCSCSLSELYEVEGIVETQYYKCKKCGTEIEKTDPDIYKEIYGLIRKNYDKYWSIYQQKISKITKGKPAEYRTE